MASTISARLTDGSKIDIKVEDIDSTTILTLKELIAAVRRLIIPSCSPTTNTPSLPPSCPGTLAPPHPLPP